MFRIRHVDNVMIVDVSGELALRNVRQLDQVIDSALDCDHGKLILDLSNLSHLDYKLVPHLVDRVVEVQCSGGDLKIASVNRYVDDILKVMGFEEERYPSVEEAVLSFTPLSDEAWH